MKHLKVPYIESLKFDSPIEIVSTCLNNIPRHELDCIPWPIYPYKPLVHFTISHSDNCIFLKFYVTEKTIRAAACDINGDVWEDACVEFFISFDESGYYNLEFNCIGTITAAFGLGRSGRQLINDEIIRKIKYGVTINNQLDGNIHWELTTCIPLHIFTYHKIKTLKTKKCKANFYKCGDKLDEPHYVTWSSIESPHPDFHLPAFFGQLSFE